MPLYAAKLALQDPNITPEDLFARIGQTNVEIGNLYCRCRSDPQLTSDLVELEKILVQLTEKYESLINKKNANSNSQQKNS
jgi:hypothetical protein